MKKNTILSLALAVAALSACKKDYVDTTDAPGAPVILPVVIPPAESDSSLLLGNPSDALANPANFSNYLMKETYYTLSYNRDWSTPNWVSWHLSLEDLGSTPRQDDFRPNDALPSGWYQVQNFSYNGGGFDRGHMCPSADRTATVPANSSTFLMTNMVPQAPVCNQTTWANLEDYARSLVTGTNKELYIIAGPAGTGGTGNSGLLNTIDNTRINVPASVWKVIVVLDNGSDDLNRINTSTRVISVIMPNSNTIGSNWRNYRVSVDDVEALTGYDLLSTLPTATQTVIESRVDNL
jgi:endonuclease G